VRYFEVKRNFMDSYPSKKFVENGLGEIGQPRSHKQARLIAEAVNGRQPKMAVSQKMTRLGR